MFFKPYCFENNIFLSDSVDQDQNTRSVQSDLDLHCPQKISKSH